MAMRVLPPASTVSGAGFVAKVPSSWRIASTNAPVRSRTWASRRVWPERAEAAGTATSARRNSRLPSCITTSRKSATLGATASASYTASGTSTAAAVDGFPINQPIWGTSGSSTATDWFALDFGRTRTVDEVRLYVRDDRSGNRYRAPASYTVQAWNGSAWVDTASQTRTPAVPRANYNLVRFSPVSTERLRVVFTHASGFRTGLTEVMAFHKGGSISTTTTTPSKHNCGSRSKRSLARSRSSTSRSLSWKNV